MSEVEHHEASEHASLRDAWHSSAAEWVRWARSPVLDHEFWRLNLPCLLDLLPAPGKLTLDIGCGEGRVARELKERGHRVIGVESSPALAAAARETDQDFHVHVADAASMPLHNGAADLAVASMMLMNVDDMPGVVREISRVLAPKGRFCLSVVHPLNSLAAGGVDTAYFAEKRYTKTVERDGSKMTFHDTHRPLESYLQALQAAGMVVEALREPVPDAKYIADHPEMRQWLDRPCFLQVRAVKVAN